MNYLKLSIVLAFFASIIFYSCDKNDSEFFGNEIPYQVTTLKGSSVVLRNKNFISSFGIIDFSKTIIKELDLGEGKSTSFMVIPILKDGIVVAAIEAVKIPKGKLPYGDDFALNLVDYSMYNLNSNTGKILMYDMNYDNYQHSIISVQNNKIKFWSAGGLSIDLKEKFKNKEFKQFSGLNNSLIQTHGENEGIYKLCDANGDHNISFSECYKCATDAIDSDGFSSFVCDIPVVGWAGCWGSKSATCVVVSSMY